MNTRFFPVRTTCPRSLVGPLAAFAARRSLLLLLLLWALPAAAQAEFEYAIEGDAVTITKYTGPGGTVTIPDSLDGLPVTVIGKDAFAFATSLIRVTIPDSIVGIGQGAFAECFSLHDVAIPDSVTSLGEWTFQGCTRLASISIPNGVTRIEPGTFQDCTGLTGITIPESVTSVGMQAFQGCAGLTSVTIPVGVTAIGVGAFRGCTCLVSVVIPNSVTKIEVVAFSGCTGLTTVTIPNSVRSIGDDAFERCSRLTFISVDPLNASYSSVDGVLFNKSRTTLIACPGGKVGNYTIPDSVTSVGMQAFEGCTGLTSVTIPVGVTAIGDWAFRGCTNLTAITVAAPNSVYSSADGVLLSRDQTRLIQCPGRKTGTYAIPPRVNRIESAAFADCTGLTSVVLPDGLTSIDGDAFAGCTRLTSVTIPSGVTSIQDGTFRNCTSLISARIPDGVASIGWEAFSGCTSLTSALIPSSVTTIGSYAFAGCTSLTSALIPSGVTTIGSYAFAGCTSLDEIVVDAFNPSYSSVDGVLFDRIQTTLIQCPGGRTGVYTVPYSVTRIDRGAFSGCTSLAGITVDPLHPSYSSLDGVLFDQAQNTLVLCPGGKAGAYTIPDSVTEIQSWAFSGCVKLASVRIGNGITRIPGEAFSNCASLTNVTIGDSVAHIEGPGQGWVFSWLGAFAGCRNLATVHFEGNAPGMGPAVFDGADNVTVYYLPGTTGWDPTLGGRPTALWLPRVETDDTSFGVRTNQFGFTITWARDKLVVVEACADLAGPVWSAVSTHTLAGGSSYFSDATWGSVPARFYRLRAP